MGSSEEYPKKQQQDRLWSKLKILLLLITTNILTFYIFTGRSPSLNLKLSEYTQHLPSLWDFNSLLQELNSTQAHLASSDTRLGDLQKQLISANLLLENLLSELGRARGSSDDRTEENPEVSEKWSDEMKLVLQPHKLPLGHSPNIGSDEIYLPIGAACSRYEEELRQYMSYEVGGECPTDNVFAQQLMLRGCEPLPRRRCHPKSPAGYVEPRPLPDSLWTTPPDTSITWDAYSCKSYQCLVDRIKTKGYYDCKDCFDLNGREKNRWVVDGSGLDYGMDAVLGTKPPGTVRIGLDIGGGSGTFAVRMKERDVTIITSTMNFDGPFNSFIASRGLIPIHLSVSHRFPFFENTLDIVHSMHVLSNWIPDAVLELVLYDIYRVLRPGGLFWLDRFFCYVSQLNQSYVPMIEKVGFNKLRWNTGRKLDRGAQMNQWYISALLEKPMT
ncbi:probable methyltransferase At1g29790 [Aristolochia californica]|uniref:probable methyltransferase At1g29790 n=1 Tax=Aristolochia californica TaxID=171875 RepID=UPI0035E2D609